ncbi:MAG: tyrosine-type recombinase/integrase [Enterococcus sp.]|nr:tyrosine-type recombinase/integrase [Enterococcus sp.]
MQMKNLIDEFIEEKKIEGRAEGTLNEYKARLKEFAEYLEQQNLPLKSVKNKDLSTFSKTLFEKCQKTSTIRSKLSAFHVFNIWAVNKNYMSTVVINPNDYPKNTKIKRIRRLTDEELAIFKSYIDNLQENIRMAFYLMLNSGCRVGEAANLRVEDVTLRGKTIFIDIKDAKWGSDRCIPVIDEQIGKIIWKYRAELEVDNRPLFRVSKRTLQNYATNFSKETGIDFHCHLLRHTFAAILTEKGVPLTTVQFLLGHKSLGMTAHYAKSALVDLSEVTKIEI